MKASSHRLTLASSTAIALKIYAVDAALQDVSLEQIDVGQLVGINRHALIAESIQECSAASYRA